MSDFLPSSYSTVLEVGCATGRFVEQLRQRSETWGIEPHRVSAEIACSRMDRVLIGTYDEVADQLPANYFDLVVCNDVMEHMVDHDKFLEDIKCKLKAEGCIVGSIPNVRHVTALFKLLCLRDWPYSESGILDRTHLRFFTEKSLRHCFQRHGWQIERLHGLDSIITHGLQRKTDPPSYLQDLMYRGLSLAVVALTLGYYADTQYPQFGFRIRLRPG